MKKITFVSLATEGYWLGAAAMIESIRANSQLKLDEYRFILFTPNSCPDWVTAWIEQRPEQIEIRVGSELDHFKCQFEQKQLRLNTAIKKLGIFGIQNTDSNIHAFIDSDIICLRSLTGMMQFSPFTGVPNSSQYVDTIDTVSDYGHINSGFFIFQPSLNDRDKLYEIYAESPEKFTDFADQDVIAEWTRLHVRPTFVSSDWNCMKGLLINVKGSVDRKLLNKVRLLHFTGNKPWEDVQQLKYSDRNYLFLERLWWKYFTDSDMASPLLDSKSALTHPYFRWFAANSNGLRRKSVRILNRLKGVPAKPQQS